MYTIIRYLIAREVKNNFALLFRRGYKIRKVNYYWSSFGAWDVFLESAECCIVISNDRDEIFVSFAPINTNDERQIGIQPMIYFLTQGNIIITDPGKDYSKNKKEQFEKYTRLLEAYLDEIVPYFGENFSIYEEELISAQNKYNARILNYYPK